METGGGEQLGKHQQKNTDDENKNANGLQQ